MATQLEKLDKLVLQSSGIVASSLTRKTPFIAKSSIHALKYKLSPPVSFLFSHMAFTPSNKKGNKLKV